MYDDYVLMQVFENTSEAYLAKTVLNSESIRAVIDDAQYDFTWVYGGHLGTKLLVHKDDLKKAQSLLPALNSEEWFEMSQKINENFADMDFGDADDLAQAEENVNNIGYRETFLSNEIQNPKQKSNDSDSNDENDDSYETSELTVNDLNNSNDSSLDIEADVFIKHIKCPKCDSINLERIKLGNIKAIIPLSILVFLLWGILQSTEIVKTNTQVTVVIGLVILTEVVLFAVSGMSRKIKCNDCGHIWKI